MWASKRVIMNKLNFNQTGGFPMSTNILDAVQTAYSLFNHLGSLAGELVIISGCIITGNTVSDGAVYINGELLEFKGGSISTNVIIKEETESRVFEDGATKPIIYKRYAGFGSSTPDKTYKWEDFKRVDNLIKQGAKNADFEKRIKALENKKSPVPIGLIAIWGKPASEPIPEGWKECTDLRGRMPLGWNPDDADFSELLKNDGEKAHQLTVAELPKVTGSFQTLSGFGENGSGVIRYQGGGQASVAGSLSNFNHAYMKMEFGGNQPHNNMPPYRIIKFIEFIGF